MGALSIARDCFNCVFTAYQTVSLSNRMGGVVIQASVEGYDCDILRLCGQELKV